MTSLSNHAYPNYFLDIMNYSLKSISEFWSSAYRVSDSGSVIDKPVSTGIKKAFVATVPKEIPESLISITRKGIKYQVENSDMEFEDVCNLRNNTLVYFKALDRGWVVGKIFRENENQLVNLPIYIISNSSQYNGSSPEKNLDIDEFSWVVASQGQFNKENIKIRRMKRIS